MSREMGMRGASLSESEGAGSLGDSDGSAVGEADAEGVDAALVAGVV
jgi:hypothetical protein